MTRRAVISQADLVRKIKDAEATNRNFQIVPTVKESLTTDAAMVARYTGQARQKARAKSAQEKRE